MCILYIYIYISIPWNHSLYSVFAHEQMLAEAYVPENLLPLVETDYNYRLCFHKELTMHGKFLEMTKNGRGERFFRRILNAPRSKL